MKKKQKIILVISAFLILVACIVGFLLMRQTRDELMIPNDVSELLQTYMEAYKRGTEYSAEYVYFNDEFMTSAYIEAGDKLLDYKIESSEKINDSLYAFTILVKSEHSTFYYGDTFQTVYNFVAQIENKWYFINGVANIPANIQANLDVTKYTYDNDNIVDSGDVIGAIDTD